MEVTDMELLLNPRERRRLCATIFGAHFIKKFIATTKCYSNAIDTEYQSTDEENVVTNTVGTVAGTVVEGNSIVGPVVDSKHCF